MNEAIISESPIKTNTNKRTVHNSETGPYKKARKNKDVIIPPPSEDDMPLNVPFRVENGIRYLDPYWTSFKTFTKGRWIGRSVLDVLRTEFIAHNQHYPYIHCKLGRILINGVQSTDPDRILEANDRIQHIAHRHEPPILDGPIEFIQNDKDFLVVNKPASLPVHPAAQYKLHTVTGILWTMYGISGLRLVHRLDRTTSGVLIFAKNYDTDIKWKQLLSNSKVVKQYVCKVEGIFPSDEVVCEQPIGPISLAAGLQCVKADGRSAKSTFRRLWTDGENSVVCAVIETGRTHQIRVHLQYLGYPILNDLIYNNKSFGPYKGRYANYGKPFEEMAKDVLGNHKHSNWFIEDPEYTKFMERTRNEENIKVEDLSQFGAFYFSNRPDYDPYCLRCNSTLKDPSMDHFRMFLHCWKYESDQFKFEAPLPEWAIEK